MPIPLTETELAAIAQTLAGRGLDLLSGVFRGAADTGVAQLAELLATKTGVSLNDIAENKVSEDQWARLKEFEFENQEKLLEYRRQSASNELASSQTKNSDLADARRMQSEALNSNDPFVRRFTYYYAALVTTATFAYIFWASFGGAYNSGNPASKVIDTVLGFLLGVTLSAIIQYFFGSSSGSKSKDQDIKDLITAMRGQGGSKP